MTALTHEPNLRSAKDPSALSSGDIGDRLELLRHLEISLKSSHQAVLHADLVQLERLTEEQRFLLLQLRRLGLPDQNQSKRRSAPEINRGVSLSAQIQQAQIRVLHLGRVQRALLQRAQQRLRALAHCHAGPETTYGLLPGSGRVVLRQVRPAVSEEG